MASCSLATLHEQACSNGFLALSDKQAKALILLGFGDISGNALDADELYAQAKSNGLCGMSDKQFGAAVLQSLCNSSEGLLAECVNLVPDGAIYDDILSPPIGMYCSGTHPFGILPNTSYQITFGVNDSRLIVNEMPPTVIDGPGTFQFTTGPSAHIDLYGFTAVGLPVTATICEV